MQCKHLQGLDISHPIFHPLLGHVVSINDTFNASLLIALVIAPFSGFHGHKVQAQIVTITAAKRT